MSNNIVNVLNLINEEGFMELIYMYIDEANAINNINFNFGGKYKFNYKKEEKKLIVERNKNYIQNFFNITNHNIMNVTGIIGENGSGKTSILNKISEMIYYNAIVKVKDYDIFTVNSILAVVKDGKLIVFCHDIFIENKVCIEDKDSLIDNIVFYGNKYVKNNIYKNNQYQVINSDILNSLSCIYFSNIFNNSWTRLTDKKRNFYNISIEGILGITGKKEINLLSPKVLRNRSEEDILKNNKHGIDVINTFKLLQIQREIEYVIKTNYDDKDISLPRIVSIIPEYIFGQPSEESIRYYNRRNKRDRSKTEKGIYSLLNDDNNINIAKKTFITAIVSEYFEEIQRPIDNIAKFIEYEEKVYLDNDIISNLNSYFSIWIEYVNSLNDRGIDIEGYRIAHNNYMKLIDTILKIIDKYPEYIHVKEGTFERVTKNEVVASIEKYAYINLDIHDNNTEIRALIENLKLINTDQNILSLKWRDISSGEYALLETFTRIYDAIKNNRMKETILVLIDEGELYLHPEWQRKYFSKIFRFFNNEFPEYKFQIVFASNTPLIITDIPKNNLVMLKKEYNNDKNLICVEENVKESFAANITSLLKNSFFMKSTMGEFAKIKIEELVNNLLDKNSSEKINKEEALIIINSIGEPVFRKKLLELFNEKYGVIQKSEIYVPIEKVRDNNELKQIKNNLIEELQKIEKMMEEK